MISLIEIGNLFTPIPVGFLVNKLGRKPLLLSIGPVYVATWILVIFVRTVEMLYLMRIVQGLALGVTFTVLPMYLSEIARADIRGALSIFFQGMWYLGILYVYAIGPYVGYVTITITCMVPCIIFMLVFCWLPESPQYLAMRGRDEAARKSLNWLRGSAERELVDKELADMKEAASLEKEEEAGWRDVLETREGRKALLIANMVAFCEIMSGVTAILSYASETFTKTSRGGLGPLTPDGITIVMGGLTFLVTLLTAGLVDRMGRRPLLMISTLGSTVCLFATAVYYHLDACSCISLSYFDWLPYSAIIVYISLISFGAGCLTPTLQAELFPNSTRGIASGITSVVITITSFICMKLYQVIQDEIGLYLNYYIFAGFCGLGSLGVYLYVPETKGKTFAEIQKMLE
ncbi:hypothetical protein AAG570_004754 [Ranatra chinensis]|uniref:Major facilitator superfamily (MFS) profile domain-containing protein n=1 Tax=Ranatra chinensis TaxID=642074 RepID=A0ABD0Y241_9HEMI